MKLIHGILLNILFLSSTAIAESYPQSHISNALSEAVKGAWIDLERLTAGEALYVDFAYQQVLIYKRTIADVETIERADRMLFADPDDSNFDVQLKDGYSSTINLPDVLLLQDARSISSRPYRSVQPKLLVVRAGAPVTGCLLKLLPKESRKSVEVFIDPCSGGRYDAAGRVLVGDLQVALEPPQPARFNLSVFPHELTSSASLKLGFIAGKIPEIPEVAFSRDYQDGGIDELLLGAANFNDEESLLKAIEGGAQLSVGPFQASPLNAAIIGSSTKIIKILLAHGAKPDYRSEILARSLGRNDVIMLLAND